MEKNKLLLFVSF